MNGLREAASQYLGMRRTLGFKLSAQARILMGFVDYCEQHDLDSITTQAAVAWAMDTPHSTDSLWWARRLMVVRIFARHLRAFDPATQVPPADALPCHYRRVTPYLYSPAQIDALMRAAGTLAPPLRAATYTTLIGLLATSVERLQEGEPGRETAGDQGQDIRQLSLELLGSTRGVPSMQISGRSPPAGPDPTCISIRCIASPVRGLPFKYEPQGRRFNGAIGRRHRRTVGASGQFGV